MILGQSDDGRREEHALGTIVEKSNFEKNKIPVSHVYSVVSVRVNTQPSQGISTEEIAYPTTVARVPEPASIATPRNHRLEVFRTVVVPSITRFVDINPELSVDPTESSQGTMSVKLLPPGYEDNGTDEWCTSRYDLSYLHHLSSSRSSYCDEKSSRSQITAFSTRLSSRDTQERQDAMFVASSAAYHRSDTVFDIHCQHKEDLHTRHEIPLVTTLEYYMYDTGPRYIFEQYINVQEDPEASQGVDMSVCSETSPSAYTILLKREGAGNLWHCLNEIFSLQLSLDVLFLAQDRSGLPQSRPNETEILILDQHVDGPYFDMWKMFSTKPIRRISERDNATSLPCAENLIIPLPGGSNPLWQGDWEAGDCHGSSLVTAFSHRVLDHLQIQRDRVPSRSLTLTFIDRTGSRKLQNQGRLLHLIALRHTNVFINIIDFARLTFREQVRTVRLTDILVGVHGAGLTHTIFLQPESAVVELFPHQLKYEVYRNVAKLMGHHYFSLHGEESDEVGDWHDSDLEVQEERWLHAIGAAIASLGHRGALEIDVE